MRRDGKPPYIPRDTLERTLRMVIERGRLAQLLFDEGGRARRAFLERGLAYDPRDAAGAADAGPGAGALAIHSRGDWPGRRPVVTENQLLTH
jgi:hypothetical protein